MSGFLGDVVEIGTFGLIDGDTFTGQAGADAARGASAAQAAAMREGIALQRESRDLARGDLQPFRAFGQSGIGPLEGMLTSQGQFDFLKSNPMFQAAVNNTSSQLKNIAAASGKANSGGLVNQLFQNYLGQGQSFIQPQINNLFNRVNLGQASAAGQANTALTSGANMSSLMGQIGDARAAGIVGAQNARTGALNSILNLGGTLGGAYLGGGMF